MSQEQKKESTDLIHITKDELTKSDNNMLNTNQLAFLLQKTPKNHIYERPAKGGGKWKYVTGVYVKKVLNLMFGWDWSFEVVEHKFDLQIKQAYVLGKLTVNSGGKSIVKMQFGRVDIKMKTAWDDKLKKKVPTDDPLDIGNDLKAATTDSLKKCASELGIASDVYAPNEFKAISVVEEKPELKPDDERIRDFIAQCKTQDDLDFIRGEVGEIHLAEFKEKQVGINKANK